MGASGALEVPEGPLEDPAASGSSAEKARPPGEDSTTFQASEGPDAAVDGDLEGDGSGSPVPSDPLDSPGEELVSGFDGGDGPGSSGFRRATSFPRSSDDSTTDGSSYPGQSSSGVAGLESEDLENALRGQSRTRFDGSVTHSPCTLLHPSGRKGKGPRRNKCRFSTVQAPAWQGGRSA